VILLVDHDAGPGVVAPDQRPPAPAVDELLADDMLLVQQGQFLRIGGTVARAEE